MFGHLIYFNNDKVTEYNALINGEEIIMYDTVDVTKEKLGEANIKFVKGEKKSIENYHGKIVRNDMVVCNNFIKNLINTDSFFDFIDGDAPYDANYLVRGNIVRFESNIIIPEKFDIIKLWDTFKERFSKEITSSADVEDHEAFGKLFETKELKIPITLKIDDKLCSSLLTSSLLKCDYESLEKLENDEIVILAKINSVNKSKDREIFNPLVDFLSFNRFMRRNLGVETDLPNELNKIHVNDNYISLEILAIYQ